MDEEFLQVDLNSYEQSPCSPPEPAPDWVGVVIRAPSRVVFKRFERVGEDGEDFAAIPVCGVYQIADRDLETAVLELHVRDVDHPERVYSGAVIDADPSPMAPIPVDENALGADEETFSDEEDFEEDDAGDEEEEDVSGSFFNPNLAHYVRLPETAARYDVWVSYGIHRSNEVRIELVEGGLQP